MISEFQQLSEKINRLAELVRLLRHENADLRLSVSSLAAEKDDLSRCMQEAHQRVAMLLEHIPAASTDEELT